MTSKGSKLKWKVLNILTSFPFSIKVHTMENYCQFVFCNNIYSFVAISIEVSWKIVRMRERKTNCTSAQDHLLAMSLIFGELRLNLLHFFFLFIQKICVKVFLPGSESSSFSFSLGKAGLSASGNWNKPKQ